MLDAYLHNTGVESSKPKKLTPAQKEAKKHDRRTQELKRLGVKPRVKNAHPDWKAAGKRGEIADTVLPGTRGWKVMHTGAETVEPPSILRPPPRGADASLPMHLRPASAPVPAESRCQTVARDRYSRCFASDLFGRTLEAAPRRLPEYARRVDVPTEEKDIVRRSARVHQPGDQPAGQGGTTVLRPPAVKGGMDDAVASRSKAVGARADKASEHMQLKENEKFVLDLKTRIGPQVKKKSIASAAKEQPTTAPRQSSAAETAAL